MSAIPTAEQNSTLFTSNCFYGGNLSWWVLFKWLSSGILHCKG